MKRPILQALGVMMIWFAATAGYSQVLFEENFDYPANDLITAHGWTAHSGGGTQPITVSQGGLIYSGYVASGIGNAALMDNNGEDDHHTFAVQTSGVVYTAFMVNVTANANGYFLHLGGDPIGSTFRGKVFIDATNHFGLSVGNNTGTFATSAFTPGTTCLLVLKYEIVAGTNNDIVSLFIFDGPLPAGEPGLPAIGPLTDAAMSDINPGSVALRQFNASQNLTVDGIRTGLSWADVLPSGVTPPTVQAHDITFSNVTPTSMTATWIKGDGGNRIVIMNTVNSFTNPDDGSNPAANSVYNGTGEQVIYNGNGNTVGVSGLTGSTEYWYRVYEYNGTGASTKYLTTTAVLNPNHQSTSIVLTPPAIGSPAVSSVTDFSALIGANITFDGGSPVTERGTVWALNPGVTLTDNKLPEGGTTTGIFSHLRNGLPSQTEIFTRAYATNNIGSSLTEEISFYTLSVAPAGHVTGFNATATGNSSVNLQWSAPAAGAAGYLILQKTGAIPPAGLPSDGTAYTAGMLLGDGLITAVVQPGSTLNQSVVGLSPGTQYSFVIIPFAWDGNHPETHHYLTTPAAPSASATTTGSASVVYTWTGADNGLWTLATNWSPARNTPAASDILQFNDGTLKTIKGVVSQTIAQFLLSNNTTINLQSASPATLTLGGAMGPDLDIPAGCTLNFNAVNALTMTLANTATADIYGNMRFSSTSSTAHRLTAADPGAIIFREGSVFNAGTFFSGNPFGNNSLNSVIFTSGSVYLQQAGSNPFGAGQPNSVVIFQPGSLFKVTANLTPSFAGRTYGDFEMDAPGITLSPTGTAGVSIGNLTITAGTLNFNMTGPSTGLHQINGNITVRSGAFLNFNPGNASVVTLNGGTQQVVTAAGTLNTNNNITLEILNGTLVSLGAPLSLNGNLQLSSGFLELNNHDLILSTTSLITGIPSVTAMVVPAGTGKLIFTLPAGFSGSLHFPVGDLTGIPGFSPATLDFTAGTVSAGSTVGINLVNDKYPSDPNTLNYLNRYWHISSSGISNFVCNALFSYLPSDVQGDEARIFSMQVDPLPFTDFGTVNNVLHQMSFPGLTEFGAFTGSQPKPSVITLAATMVDATTATLNGSVNAHYLPSDAGFEYGLTTAYGTVVQAVPANVAGGVPDPILAGIAGLTQNTTYHFRAIGTSVQGTTYGEDRTFTTTCPEPSAAGAISGPASVCPNSSGNIFTVPVITNATTYNWSLPAGATITAGSGTNTITVGFSAAAVPGLITVNGSSVCGSGATSPPHNVAIYQAPVPVISGPTPACLGSQGNIYTTEPGMTNYIWNVSSGGAITAGAGTNTVTVSWNNAGNQQLTVSYDDANGCQPVLATQYPVSVENLPVPTISGPSVVCANAEGIVYTTEPGMSNYNWAVSIGGFIVNGAGTNSVTVLWPYAGNRTVSVTYNTPAGCLSASPTVFSVTVNPAAVPVIGSTNTPCINSSGNQYITNQGMSGYQWTISPGGTIDAGQGTNNINVTWNAIGTQWVKVSFTNTYGCASAAPGVYNLFVEPLPNAAGPVSGPDQFCAGTGGLVYSCNPVNNATSYQWNLPAGAAIVSGSGTNQIVVDFSTEAGSGQISVAGVNFCGPGAASPALAVTVHPIPPAPVVTASGNILTSSAPTGNQWYYEGNAIPGATGKIWNAAETGYYWCTVTLNGCTSPESNKVYVVITSAAEIPESSISLFPVPNQGKFSIRFTGMSNSEINLRIVNSFGTVVHQSMHHAGEGTTLIDMLLPNLADGVYYAEFTTGTSRTFRKILIHK